MKKIYLLLVVLIVVSVGGIFLYKWFAPREEADPFKVIPASAAIIIETSDIHNTWENLKAQKVWQNLNAFSYINNFNQRIAALDSFIGEDKKIEFLTGKKILTSLHVISSNEFDCVFYVPINSGKDEGMLNEITDYFENEKKYTIEKREFNNYTITEVKSKKTGLNFSFILYKNLLIGSYTPLLVEDVVRVISNKSINFFWKKEEVRTTKIVQEKVTLYVKYDKLPAFAGIFSDQEVTSFFKPLSFFAEESVMELNINDKEIHLNGFTNTSERKADFINVFKGQKPQHFFLKNYIPNTTAVLYYYGFDNAPVLKKELNNYWKKNDPEQLKEQEKVNSTYNINVSDLYEEFNNEIGLAILDSDTSSVQKLLFIHAKDSERLFLHLSKFVTIANGINPISLKNEISDGTRIKQMNIEEFPSVLLGKFFSGFDECYYAVIDDYVVFSNSSKNIKDLIKDIDAENVWGKTLKINSSLGETITEFNIGFYVNISRGLDKLVEASSPGVKEEIKRNRSLWQGFDFLAVQFSHLNETIFSNIVLTHNLGENLRIEEKKPLNNDIVFDSHVLKDFYLVDNKNDGKDILFQDSLLQLYLMGQEGKIKWKNSMKDTISGEVFTVDINKDRNWEFLFAAGNKIYCYDANGSMLKGFPFVLPDNTSLVNLSVVDYGNTKDYRVIVSDSEGNAYIYNVKGEVLDGWKPKKMGAKLSDKVRHLRVGDKDVMIALQEDGIINMMNRKGEMYPGFPVNLKGKTLYPLIIQKGKDFEKSILTTLMEDGQLISVNLNGKIIKNEKLQADFSEESSVLICSDKSQAFVIVKPSKDGFSIFSKDLKKLFDVNINFKDVSIKYYNFSTNKEFICIKDKKSKKLFIYDGRGALLKDSPQNSGNASGIFYNEKKKNYQLYNRYLNRLQLIEL